MNYGYLNIGSLILGLIAWIFPILILANSNKIENKNRFAFSIVSLSACTISLFLQIIYQDYLVIKEDWSAIMDTSHGLVVVSAILIAITLALNIVTFVAYCKRHSK